MKILSPRLHGYLDYVTVLWFLVAPTLFQLSGTPATIAYGLAIIHLLLTLFTAFPLGIVKTISFKIHSAIEFVVSFTLMALPSLLGFSSTIPARNFYIVSGVVIFVVWLLTNYKAEKVRNHAIPNLADGQVK